MTDLTIAPAVSLELTARKLLRGCVNHTLDEDDINRNCAVNAKDAVAAIRVALTQNQVSTGWKSITTAPKSPEITTALYVLCYVPDLASKTDPDAGVCVCWWEQGAQKWFSEAVMDFDNEGAKPTHWLCQVTAPKT